MTVDEKARLEHVIGAALNDGWRHEAGRLADKVLAEFDLTPKPPQPAGPVTFEAEITVLGNSTYFRGSPEVEAISGKGFRAGQTVRVTVEDAASPSTLLTPAEVERRVRAWIGSDTLLPTDGHIANSLIAALTAPTREGT